MGDFNGDGKADLVVALSAGDPGVVAGARVSVLLGNGVGSFAPPLTTALRDASEPALAVADFNGDGKADLAVNDNTGARVAILLGDGAGRFTDAGRYAGGGASLVVGDFNEDGKADLAEPGVSILAGDGRGGFGTPAYFETDLGQLAAGDINGDGHRDLVVVGDGNEVSILLGDGTGHFAPAVRHAVGLLPWSVGVADFDGDGKTDLAVANFSSNDVSVLLGDGAGSFPESAVVLPVAEPGTSMGKTAVADFNLDGALDLVALDVPPFDALPIPGRVSVFLGNGRGGFAAPARFDLGGGAAALAVGDFNADGKPDLALATNDTTYAEVRWDVSILLGDGAGGFAPPVKYPVPTVLAVAVAVADLNGDGKQDVVAASYRGSVSILLGDGSGSFAPALTRTISGSSSLSSLAVGDWNGDGETDLAVTDLTTRAVLLLAGDGSGGFAPPKRLATGGFPQFTLLRDLDGDGNVDLAVGTHLPPADPTDPGRQDTVLIFMGKGEGKFAPSDRYPVQSMPAFIAGADVNGDGKGDLVTANYGSQSVSVLLGDGSGRFSPPLNVGVGLFPVSVQAGDFDGDGSVDLAVANSQRGDVWLLVNTTTLVVTVEDGVTAVRPGQSVTYAVTVANRGTADVTALVRDPLPRQVLSGPWTCTATEGSTCGTNGRGGILDTASLLRGGSATYTLTGKVRMGARGLVRNTATAEAGGGSAQPSRNSSTDTDVLLLR